MNLQRHVQTKTELPWLHWFAFATAQRLTLQQDNPGFNPIESSRYQWF